MPRREIRDKNKVIYPALSYSIIGALYDVFNEIGWSHKEKYIQNAIAKALTDAELSFKKEQKVDLIYKEEKVGLYFIDFLIEEKVVLEIKRRNDFSQQDIKQIFSYLKATNKKLGILAHFTSKGVRIKRIVNID